jgi:hypothetical protein
LFDFCLSAGVATAYSFFRSRHFICFKSRTISLPPTMVDRPAYSPRVWMKNPLAVGPAAAIPVVGVSFEDGRELSSLVRAGRAKVRLETTGASYRTRCVNLVAELGPADPTAEDYTDKTWYEVPTVTHLVAEVLACVYEIWDEIISGTGDGEIGRAHV